MRKLAIVISWILLLTIPQAASAEYGVIPESAMDPSVVKIDEEKYLGNRLSGDYILIDESGKEFQLRDITGRPVILLLSYFSCNGLCQTANQGLKDALSSLSRLKIGEDFRVLT
ncbi:MAG: SCO family protein, partial [Nitrospirota bacterium]|nr:SCO family protein [Nitrospirota bacterium]